MTEISLQDMSYKSRHKKVQHSFFKKELNLKGQHSFFKKELNLKGQIEEKKELCIQGSFLGFSLALWAPSKLFSSLRDALHEKKPEP